MTPTSLTAAVAVAPRTGKSI